MTTRPWSAPLAGVISHGDALQQTLIADKNCYGRDVEPTLTQAGLHLACACYARAAKADPNTTTSGSSNPYTKSSNGSSTPANLSSAPYRPTTTNTLLELIT